MADEKKTFSDDDLRSLLAQYDGDPTALSLHYVHLMRRDKAVADKSTQPKMTALASDISLHRNDLATVVSNFRRPFTDAETKNWTQGFDMELASFQETLDSGNLEDAILHAFRIARRAHLQVFGPSNLDIDPAKWTPQAKKQFDRKG